MSIRHLSAFFGAVSTVSAATASGDYYFQKFATLLVDEGRPSITQLDGLVREIYASDVYSTIIKAEQVAESEFFVLLNSVVPPIPADSQSNLKGPTKATGASTLGSNVYAGVPTTDLSTPTGLVDATGSSIQYIGTTIAALSNLVLVIKKMDADVKAQNYVDAVQRLDTELNVPLAQIANEAFDRLSMSTDSAKAWKDAIWQLHLLVANYVSDKKGIDEWNDFREQLTAGLKKLVNYAVVAQTTSHSYVPSAGESTAQLRKDLKNNVVDTTCLCVWRCIYRFCFPGSRQSAATTPEPPPSNDDISRITPNSADFQSIQTVLFIESSVAALKSLVRELATLNASGPEGRDRLKNYQLRLAIRIVNIIKQALLNGSFANIYEKLKSRSLLLLGTMSGVATATSWDTVKDNISATISAMVSDLNDSKPSVV